MRIGILFWLIVLSYQGWSCGLCRYYQYGPKTDGSFIDVTYNYRYYNGYNRENPLQLPSAMWTGSTARIAHAPSTDVLIDQTSDDYRAYHAIEVRANLNLFDKLDISLILPYETNSIYYGGVIKLDGTSTVSDSLLSFSGWGHTLGTLSFTHTWGNLIQHTLQPGLAVNFSQRAENITSATSLQTDHSVQPGAFMPQLFATLMYSLESNRSNLRFQGAYGWSSENDPEYWFGATTNLQVEYFHEVSFSEFKLFPGGGVNYEHMATDIEYNERVPDTGGHAIHTFAGVSLRYGSLGMESYFHIPVHQNLSGSQMESAMRVTLRTRWNF